MFRRPVTAEKVHGEDGMGDLDLIHPKRRPETVHGVDFLLDQVRKYPGEVELVMLGPATNVAAAILRDREAMAGLKHIWSMGTSGFGRGNTTPVAEFNVYADPDSYRVLLDSGIPLTIIGADVSLGTGAGEAAWDRGDMERVAASGPVGRFAVDCNRALLAYNLRNGVYMVDLPDAVAMSVALWSEVTLESKDCGCYCHTGEDPCQGQVIFYDPAEELAVPTQMPAARARVVTRLDGARYKKRLEALLAQK